MKRKRMMNKAGTQKLVEHHVVYKSTDHPRAQSDITLFIGEGDHCVITDVQHRVANDNWAMGLCLIYEGFKRVLYAAAQFQLQRLKDATHRKDDPSGPCEK